MELILCCNFCRDFAAFGVVRYATWSQRVCRWLVNSKGIRLYSSLFIYVSTIDYWNLLLCYCSGTFITSHAVLIWTFGNVFNHIQL